MLVRLPFYVGFPLSSLSLDRLQLNEPISTVPTIGFNVETVMCIEVVLVADQIQQLDLPSVGFGRTNQHSSLLEVLLPEYRYPVRAVFCR